MITTIWAKTGMHSTTECTFEGPGWHCVMKVMADGTCIGPKCVGSPVNMYPLTVKVYDEAWRRTKVIIFQDECETCRKLEGKEVYTN